MDIKAKLSEIQEKYNTNSVLINEHQQELVRLNNEQRKLEGSFEILSELLESQDDPPVDTEVSK